MFRRLLALLALFALAVLTTAIAAAPAAVAVPYPPVIRVPIVTATSYDPCAGASNVIGGRGFLPGETVRIDLAGTGEIGRAVIAEDSTFKVTVTIPLAARGSNQLTVTGLTSGRTSHLTLEIPCVVGGGGDGSGADGQSDGREDGSGFGSGSGLLASTGAQVGGVLLLGAVLVGVGGVLAVAGKRRRGTSP